MESQVEVESTSSQVITLRALPVELLGHMALREGIEPPRLKVITP